MDGTGFPLHSLNWPTARGRRTAYAYIRTVPSASKNLKRILLADGTVAGRRWEGSEFRNNSSVCDFRRTDSTTTPPQKGVRLKFTYLGSDFVCTVCSISASEDSHYS